MGNSWKRVIVSPLSLERNCSQLTQYRAQSRCYYRPPPRIYSRSRVIPVFPPRVGPTGKIAPENSNSVVIIAHQGLRRTSGSYDSLFEGQGARSPYTFNVDYLHQMNYLVRYGKCGRKGNYSFVQDVRQHLHYTSQPTSIIYTCTQACLDGECIGDRSGTLYIP